MSEQKEKKKVRSRLIKCCCITLLLGILIGIFIVGNQNQDENGGDVPPVR